MKQHLTSMVAAGVLAIPSMALAGQTINLKGISAADGKSVSAFSSTRDLLPSTVRSVKTASTAGSGLKSNKSVLKAATLPEVDPNCHKNPVCPEPASFAAIGVGLVALVRLRKSSR